MCHRNLCSINTDVMWMRHTVFFKAAYWDLPARNKWRHLVQNTDERRTTLFRTTVSYWQAPRVVFYKKKGSGIWPPEELKACLREYCLPQRAINGRNRVLKAAFNQTGWHSLGDVHRICVYLFTWRYSSNLRGRFCRALGVQRWGLRRVAELQQPCRLLLVNLVCCLNQCEPNLPIWPKYFAMR